MESLYNSVVLAALLHDIGKLIHRQSGAKYHQTGGHAKASYDFVEKHAGKLKNCDLYDIDLVAFLVKSHHSYTAKDIYIPQCLKGTPEEEVKKKIHDLVRIVKDADSYSCTERDKDEQDKRDGEKRLARLDSIFSCMSIETTARTEWAKSQYNLGELDPARNFPDSSFKELNDSDIHSHIEKLESALPDFSHFKKFDAVLAAWIDLLERYTWCVPSDTRYEFTDISLFDHLRSSAAIAACLYRTHEDEIGTWSFSRKEEITLVAGDFSGIQDYIFHITNVGTGGAAKRLRARSFYVTLFTEATVHKVLHALNMPLLCNIFSSGGKFMLLVPSKDKEEMDKKLQQVKKEIEREIHKHHFSVFSFLMSWKAIKSFKKDMKVLDFVELAGEMFHMLETEKAGRARGALTAADGRWDPGAFKATKLYESYGTHGDCKVCGRGPAERNDGEGGDVGTCRFCHRDKEIIGKKLPKADYVAFGRGRPTEGDGRIWLFDPAGDGCDGYYAEILEGKTEKTDDFYLVYALSDVAATDTLSPSQPSIKRFIANHVPTENGAGDILPFDKIAELSRWTKDSMEYGSDLLGVLKVDIDNLGLLFSKGFEFKRNGNEGENCDRKTPSRFLTLSRMIDLFFSGWMKKSLACSDTEGVKKRFAGLEESSSALLGGYLDKSCIDLKNIYTVYSAGDDMVLVGPWETMIVFALYLHQSFTSFTGGNPSFTISAGLAFVKPKYPVAYAIRLADELLEKSKESEKNRITLFGTTVEWKAMDKLVDFFLSLDKFFNDKKSKVNASFLYRLLGYNEMALDYVKNKKVNGLKYLSALSYDIERNIIKRNKDGRIISGEEEQRLFEVLQGHAVPKDDSIISNIKIPVFWALYRNRRADRDE